MNLPPGADSKPRLQVVILRVRFNEVLGRSPLTLATFCNLVQRLVREAGLGAIVLDPEKEVVLAFEGDESSIDLALNALRASRNVDMAIAWRVHVSERRYHPILARPTLTPGERAWLNTEIRTGFSNLGTLPTLFDWLALRQTHASPSLQSELLVGRVATRKDRPCANILPFRPRRD